MPGPFAITAATNTIFLDDKRQAATSFTVFNTSGRQIRGRAQIIAQNPATQAWITLTGEAWRDFAIAGTQQYSLQITVPPTAPAGSYPFRLDVEGVDNPTDVSEGPLVQFTVPAPIAQKKGFPILIPIAAIVALLLVGAIAYFLWQNSQKDQQAAAATATATTVAATNTAVTIKATSTAVVAATASATAQVAVEATQTEVARPTATPDIGGMLPIFDFVDKQYNADWQAGPPTVTLNFGSGAESVGTILHQDSAILSDGSTVGEIIEAHPNNAGGFINGCYLELLQTGYVTKADDVISGKVAFLKNYNSDDPIVGTATFKVIIQAEGLPDAVLGEIPLQYADGMKMFALQIGSKYANRQATFCLRVEANGPDKPGDSAWTEVFLNREPGE